MSQETGMLVTLYPARKVYGILMTLPYFDR